MLATRVGAIQMCSTDDLAANLAATRALVAEAADRGCELIGLPENFAFLRREGRPIDHNHNDVGQPPSWPMIDQMLDLADQDWAALVYTDASSN